MPPLGVLSLILSYDVMYVTSSPKQYQIGFLHDWGIPKIKKNGQNRKVLTVFLAEKEGFEP